ncbi:MAG TPA: ABC-F family ATP-binding cassette domain-containing protein [Aggregatilineales bacterium]|nr:ABC-F family ATP-binding cassette domain-containing protein [Aggregatilineales bacterium]
MLTVSNLARQFPGVETPLFHDISFTVNAGERVGLIGPNGCGKTTLLSMIVGATRAERGSISLMPPDLRIGYLAQGMEYPDAMLIRDVLYPQRRLLAQAEADVERLAAELSGDPRQAAAYAEALERIERYSVEIDTRRGESLLAGLDLASLALDTPVGALSGGQKTRLGIAALLVGDPKLLILDEPTNHLDVSALEWLEAWLSSFPGAALIVSHDRTFLDRTVNRIVAMADGTARSFEGSYSDYVRIIRSEVDKQWAQWRDQQLEIARLRDDTRRTMGFSMRTETATNDSSARRLSKKVAQRAKAKEKRLERYLESEERVEKPAQTWNLKLDFGDLPAPGNDVIMLEGLRIGYNPNRPLLTDLNLRLHAGERIALLGPNGHGKTTLLRTIIGEVPPLAGRVRVGSSVRIGYLAQEQEILDRQSNALATLMAIVPSFTQTEARSFLHFFLFTGEDVFRPVALLSYGERVRLMLAILVARGANVLLLDEPINHLDVPTRERFETALRAFQGSVLAVVHDRYFVDRFATTIWQVENGVLTLEIREPIME